MLYAGLFRNDRPLQLREVAEMLSKSEEPQTVLQGLAAIGPLVEAAPDELASYAGASSLLARNTLICGTAVRLI